MPNTAIVAAHYRIEALEKQLAAERASHRATKQNAATEISAMRSQIEGAQTIMNVGSPMLLIAVIAAAYAFIHIW